MLAGWRWGVFISSATSSSSLVSSSPCTPVGVFIPVGASSLPTGSLLTPVSGLLGSGVALFLGKR